MKVTVISTFLLAVFLTKSCNAKYEVKGNHWGDDNDVNNIREYAKIMANEWAEMVANKDAGDMVEKFADDGVYIRQGNPPAIGKEAAKELYQSWFDSGVANVDVEIDRVGSLGHGYMYMLETVKSMDKNGDHFSTNRLLVVFRKVEDGYQTFLKSETIDYE